MSEQKKDIEPNEGKTRTTVLIVDDHDVVVQGIERAFDGNPGFEVVGTARDGSEALALAKSLSPDVVIMDISMPKLNGIEAAHFFKTAGLQTRIVIYSMYSDKEYVLSLFKAGISAYVLKSEPVADLLLGVRVVCEGGAYFSKSIHETIRKQMEESSGNKEEGKGEEDDFSKLSTREKEIFLLLADGRTPRQIAGELHISPKTVESHKYNMMEKLNVSSVAQLTKIAFKRGMIHV